MSTESLARTYLRPERTLATLTEEHTAVQLADATWYVAQEVDDGLAYRFDAGALAAMRYVTADFLLDGTHLAVFAVDLQEGEGGPNFRLHFGLLNQCQARMRFALALVDQNRWMVDREGAWLKPICSGDRVDLAKVDRLTITVIRKSDEPVRFCLTPLTASAAEPERITTPLLPRGPLLDALGQSTIHDWAAKSRDGAEVTARLQEQRRASADQRWPADFSTWGGSTEWQWEATGFFRTHHDGARWWLVDPDGFAFWSAGLDCVGPNVDTSYADLEAALTDLPAADGPLGAARRTWHDRPAVDYLKANLMLAFGPEGWHQEWATVTLAQLRGMGFNTVGNWSDWRVASAGRFPYVRPLTLRFSHTPLIYRDFPDVYDPAFAADTAAFAEQLTETVGDPALIGYFLGNEPTWGFASESPAAGMLYVTETCATRRAFSETLRARYCDDAGLTSAWEMPVRLADVAAGQWSAPLSDAARRDCEAFSGVMAKELFDGLSGACRAVDPHHLNLGARYHTVPPEWAIDAMRSFDVFSVNSYRELVPDSLLAPVSARLERPVMIGEWHFGALDVGLAASGIGRVHDQAARGQAYRCYVEDAASRPWCVGVHYFTLYDQSALGRFDGEAYNIGLLDVCHRPYAPLVEATRTAHERIYAVARGDAAPYRDAPEYLSRLFG